MLVIDCLYQINILSICRLLWRRPSVISFFRTDRCINNLDMPSGLAICLHALRARPYHAGLNQLLFADGDEWRRGEREESGRLNTYKLYFQIADRHVIVATQSLLYGVVILELYPFSLVIERERRFLS